MISPISGHWIRNGRLADGAVVDLRIQDGLIAEIQTSGAAEGAAKDINLNQWLLLPAMAEPHAHLDKALTADLVPNPDGNLLGAIEAWVGAAAGGQITHTGIVERAVTAMEKLLASGATAVRTHVNVTESLGATAVVALKEAAAHLDGLLEVQIVALCSSPITGPEGRAVRAALAAALEAGANLVGGCPHLDPNPAGLITVVIEAATEAGVGIDLHVDEMLDPSVLTLRLLAREVLATGFNGLVAASHCVTLGMQPPAIQAQVAKEVAEAEIAVFALPQTNLFLQGRDHQTATPRGLTAVRALQDAGVLVAAGADNVQDPFNLVGRSDPLETAALMVMAGHQLPEAAFQMVSSNARRAIGLPQANLLPGDPADFVAIKAASVREAIADASMNRRVFRRGVLVASTDQQTSIHRL